jgi:hypothetical protein
MKARWLACVLLVSVLAVACAQPTPEAPGSYASKMEGDGVGVGQVYAASGDQVDVPLEVANVSNVGSLHAELVYDPSVLRAVSVRAGSLHSGGLFESNIDAPGRVVVGMASTQGISGSGEVAVVSFDVVGQDGATCNLAVENVEANDATTLNRIGMPVQSGSCEVGAAARLADQPGQPQSLLPWFTGGGSGTMLCALGLIVLLAVMIIWYVGRGGLADRGARAPAAAGKQLWVTKGSATPSTLPLDKDVVTLGRDASNDMAIHDDGVSRQHAQIRHEGGQDMLYDNNSTNGTFLNGERISSPRLLTSGDRIAMGDCEIAYG